MLSKRSERLLYHNEPIWRDGHLVGRVCSGMFGHTPGSERWGSATSAMAEPRSPAEWITAGRYEVEVAAERMPARVSLRPFYDPSGTRVRQ